MWPAAEKSRLHDEGNALDSETVTALLNQQQAPMALFVTGKGALKPWGVSAGMADPFAGRLLTVDTPLRIASNTKTFVAATILRLREQGRIVLDAPIAPLITPVLNDLLKSAGYDTAAITVHQLLNHSGGLYDHGDDPRYIESVLAAPAYAWTREEQVRLAVQYSAPVGKPGYVFQYSDTGYILLGDIIERLTGEPLAKVVRRELSFDRLALKSAWWEIAEPRPSDTEPRGCQFLGDIDATEISATMDLYGGGGLVMSVRDLAAFTAHLFELRIFENPGTLREMLSQGTHDGAEAYRLGIAVTRMGDFEFYSHLGFWGTATYYSPAAGIAVAGFTTSREARPALVAVIEQILIATTSAP